MNIQEKGKQDKCQIENLTEDIVKKFDTMP